MLKKTERLSRIEFSRYFKSGKRSNSEYLTIVQSPAPVFKAAVVVGKKVFKEAVDRNRLRRQIYALLQTKKTGTGVYLILVKPPLTKLKNKERLQVVATELGRVIN